MEALCVDNVVSGLTSCGLWRASTLKSLVHDQWLSSKFLESAVCPPYEVSFSHLRGLEIFLPLWTYKVFTILRKIYRMR